MADLSLKFLAGLFQGGRDRLIEVAGRVSTRIIGAAFMAALLMLNQFWPLDWVVGSGVFLLALMAGLMLRAHLKHVCPKVDERRRTERVIWFTSVLAVIGVQIANLSLEGTELGRAGFLLFAPLVAQSMLIAALVTPGVAIAGLSMTVLLMGIPGVLPTEFLFGAWLSGAIGAHVVNPLKQRSDLIRAMSIQVVAQVVIAASMVMISNQIRLPAYEAAIWGAVAAIGATAIFWLAVAIFEKLFGIVSDWTLLELGNPEHPLLRELVLRTPGTYAHSVGVANLSEEAARAVGANPLLVRTMRTTTTAAKQSARIFFVENQIGSNLHDDLSPNLSAQIVAAHVEDGLKLGKEHGLPQIILDGIAQHHGTSLITFFFHRAVQETGVDPCEHFQEKFRYPGPKPQSKETAILHLADIAEAATRAMPSTENLEEFVENLIESSRADGQLDECDLTFRDLETIKDAFCRCLRAIRHERVTYPVKEESEQETAVSGHDSQRHQEAQSL
ncbi:HDIG domain-containing protein [Kamptonema cortianum]|nr:HDIG domain-containing protein [Kamptonema cortianum]